MFTIEPISYVNSTQRIQWRIQSLDHELELDQKVKGLIGGLKAQQKILLNEQADLKKFTFKSLFTHIHHFFFGASFEEDMRNRSLKSIERDIGMLENNPIDFFKKYDTLPKAMALLEKNKEASSPQIELQTLC